MRAAVMLWQLVATHSREQLAMSCKVSRCYVAPPFIGARHDITPPARQDHANRPPTQTNPERIYT